MIRPLFSLSFLLAVVPLNAQVSGSYEQIQIVGGKIAGFSVNSQAGTRRIVIGGTAANPARVRQKTESGYVELTSNGEMTVNTKPGRDAKGRRREVISTAEAGGGVKVTQFNEPKQMTSVITGSKADYVLSGKTGNLDLAGPVEITMTDGAKKRNLLGKGREAKAILLPDSENPLQTATLIGNVSIDVDQLPFVDPETKESIEQGNYKASGGKLVYDLTGANPTVTMTENVKLAGVSGLDNGTTSGIERLFMVLTAKGELKSAEATGGAVETIVNTTKKPGAPRKR